MMGKYDLRSGDVREGAPYHQPGTRAPGMLAQTKHGSQGATYMVKRDIDPQAVQLDRAKSDVVVARSLGRW